MTYEVLIAFLVLSLYVLFQFLRWIYRRKKILKIFKENGIPGPEPSFFSGNSHQLKNAPTPNEVITGWLKQYGNVFGYFIGENPHLVVNDSNLLKQAMLQESSHFMNRPPMFLKIKPLIHTVLCLEGQRWKEVRSVLTPSFSSNKIKLMTSIMEQKTTNMVRVVERKAAANEMFDMYEVVQCLTLDVIAACALAMKVNCLENPNDPFFLAVRNYFRYAYNKIVECAIYFPFIASILKFVANFVTAGQMTTMIVTNVKEVISQRRRNVGIRGNDMLQMMLDAAENREGLAEPSTRRNVLLTDDEIIANAYLFLLAGYETTATALAFTFYLLAKHPEEQENLYKEIISELKEWSYDGVEKLQYLDKVFDESLRLYPPVTGFVTRMCQAECRLGDVVVPKGVVLQAPIWDIHHNPSEWEDPWKFNPERFPDKSHKKSLEFFPFGLGPRKCIGLRFATLEAKLAIARMVQMFKFVPCEKTDDQLQLVCPTVIINPANGVYLRAVLRE